MTNNDDKLLERFFSEAARTDIPDAGFSRRVMRSLPDRTLLKARLWRAFCVAACLALAVGLRVWAQLGGWAAGVLGAMAEAGLPRVNLLHAAVALAVALALAVREVVDRERAWW